MNSWANKYFRQTATKRKNGNLLSIDTPNRVKIVKDGPPKVEENSIIGCGAYGTVYRASYKGKY